MVTFSIITVCYNNFHGLNQTIHSVISQVFDNYEFIIIDGGSTDGSLELLNEHNNEITYWCSEKDRGIYHAMNKGIDRASGEYVIFMNSGDVFHDKEVLQKISSYAGNADLISGYSLTADTHNRTHPHEGNLLHVLMYSSLSHQATFIRRELLLKYKYDEKYRIASDWKFWLQALLFEHCSLEFVDVVVAIQDMTGITTGQDSRIAQDKEREHILIELFPSILSGADFSNRDLIVQRSLQLVQDRMHCAVMLKNRRQFYNTYKELKKYRREDVIRYLGKGNRFLLLFKTNYNTIRLFLFLRGWLKGY